MGWMLVGQFQVKYVNAFFELDKVDYLLRDSLFTNVGNRLRKVNLKNNLNRFHISFEFQNDWKRVVDYSSVTMHPEEDRNCISYHKKVRYIILVILVDPSCHPLF
jgi:hypothetical protein